MVPQADTDAGFSARKDCFYTAAAAAAHQWFASDGTWRRRSKPLETREVYWLALCLYDRGECAWADRLIGQTETCSYHGIRFDVFDTNIAVALLALHREKMAAPARAKLETLARDGFSFKPGNRQPDY